MSLKPQFTRLPAVGGSNDNKLPLGYTSEAVAYKSKAVKNLALYISKQSADIERAAKDKVKRLGGDPGDRTDVLGQFEVQFGVFKGKSFK